MLRFIAAWQINYPYIRRRRDFGKHAAFTAPPAQVGTLTQD